MASSNMEVKQRNNQSQQSMVQSNNQQKQNELSDSQSLSDSKKLSHYNDLMWLASMWLVIKESANTKLLRNN